jgi:hypothetical protein
VAETLTALFAATWQRDDAEQAGVGGEAVQLASNWVVLDAALGALEGGQLHAQVDAEVRQMLSEWSTWLARHASEGARGASRRTAADTIAKYLADPKAVKLRTPPPIPPGAPI